MNTNTDRDSGQPIHGEYGTQHTSITAGESGRTVAVTTGKARWCATCREWVYAKSIVGMVLGAVACPKCETKW